MIANTSALGCRSKHRSASIPHRRSCASCSLARRLSCVSSLAAMAESQRRACDSLPTAFAAYEPLHNTFAPLPLPRPDGRLPGICAIQIRGPVAGSETHCRTAASNSGKPVTRGRSFHGLTSGWLTSCGRGGLGGSSNLAVGYVRPFESRRTQ